MAKKEILKHNQEYCHQGMIISETIVPHFYTSIKFSHFLKKTIKCISNQIRIILTYIYIKIAQYI